MWANRLPLSLPSHLIGVQLFRCYPNSSGCSCCAASQLSLELLPVQLTHVAFFGCRCSYTATGPFEQQLNNE